MTRTMYDSDVAADIPANAEMVAGYVDLWSAADWARFLPNCTRVRIARNAATDDGHVLDVETGDATPEQAPQWAHKRRVAGVEPSVYMNASTWDAVRAAFTAQGVTEPAYWVAFYDGGHDATIPAGAVAHQYADSTTSGGHYDLSAVADYWPGVDPTPAPPPEDVTLSSQEFEQLSATITANKKQADYRFVEMGYMACLGRTIEPEAFAGNPSLVDWWVTMINAQSWEKFIEYLCGTPEGKAFAATGIADTAGHEGSVAVPNPPPRPPVQPATLQGP